MVGFVSIMIISMNMIIKVMVYSLSLMITIFDNDKIMNIMIAI